MAGTVEIDASNAVCAIELSDGAGGVSGAGTYVDVPSVVDAFTLVSKRGSKEFKPFGSTVSVYLFSKIVNFDPIVLKGLFKYAHSTHGMASGLRAHYHYKTPGFGLMVKGPEYSAGTADETILTVQCVQFDIEHGPDTDGYMFAATLQPTGGFSINGTSFS